MKWRNNQDVNFLLPGNLGHGSHYRLRRMAPPSHSHDDRSEHPRQSDAIPTVQRTSREGVWEILYMQTRARQRRGGGP